jgi:hypothetical protein
MKTHFVVTYLIGGLAMPIVVSWHYVATLSVFRRPWVFHRLSMMFVSYADGNPTSEKKKVIFSVLCIHS